MQRIADQQNVGPTGSIKLTQNLDTKFSSLTPGNIKANSPIVARSAQVRGSPITVVSKTNNSQFIVPPSGQILELQNTQPQTTLLNTAPPLVKQTTFTSKGEVPIAQVPGQGIPQGGTSMILNTNTTQTSRLAHINQVVGMGQRSVASAAATENKVLLNSQTKQTITPSNKAASTNAKRPTKQKIAQAPAPPQVSPKTQRKKTAAISTPTPEFQGNQMQYLSNTQPITMPPNLPQTVMSTVNPNLQTMGNVTHTMNVPTQSPQGHYLHGLPSGVTMYPGVNQQTGIPGPPTPTTPSSTPLSTLLALYSITHLPTSTPQIQEIIRRKDTPESQKVEDLRRVIQEHTNRTH